MRNLILAPVFAFAAGGAQAHAFLTSAMPAVGGTVRETPAAIVLEFTEGVEPSFSTVAVHDAQGADVTDGKPRRAGDPSRLAIAVKKLAPGVYTVVWHAVSTDTHKTDGTFSFTVVP